MYGQVRSGNRRNNGIENRSLYKRSQQNGKGISYECEIDCEDETVNLLDTSNDDEEVIEVETPSHNTITSKPGRLIFIFICLIFFSLFYIPISQTGTKRRSVALPGWWSNISRNVENYVFPYRNTTIIDPSYICDSRNSEKIFILIVVCSSARNFDARESIRETWGNVSNFNYNKFHKMHEDLKGVFLEPNAKNWEEYTSTEDLSEATILNELKGIAVTEKKEIRPISEQKFTVKLIFLVGQTQYAFMEEEYTDEVQNRINQEAESYGDILQEGFLDTYNNLTLKSIMLLKWVTNNCDDKVKYVLKVDDDTFVNIPNLIHILLGGTVPLYNASVSFYDRESIIVKAAKNRLPNSKNLLVGHLFCGVKPVADVSSKWYSPYYLFPSDMYPSYLSGTAYLMSLNAVHRLYNTSLSTPFFHLEDVYITGICANKTGIKRMHHPLFFYSSIKDKDKQYCSLRGMVSQHHLSPSDMKQAFDLVTNTTSVKCPAPKTKVFLPKLKLQMKRKC